LGGNIQSFDVLGFHEVTSTNRIPKRATRVPKKDVRMEATHKGCAVAWGVGAAIFGGKTVAI